jgi:type II secretory pathway pseudopilin PulG
MTRRAAGFTLIELLLALLTTSILMLALGGTLSTAFKARDTALAKAAETRGVHTALEMLRRDLESALPPSGILAGPFVAMPNAGASHSLQLHCVRRSGGPVSTAGLAGGMAAGGLQGAGFTGVARVEIGVGQTEDPDDPTPALVRQVTRNLLAPVVAPPSSEVLCRRVRAFRCRFFDGLQWLETWDSTTQGNVLPAAVQIELEIETPGYKGGEPGIHRAQRIFTLPCHTEAQATQAGTGQQGGGQ